MPRRTSIPRTSFFGFEFHTGIFVLLVAYAIVLFMGGTLSYFLVPTPSRFGINYGIMAALTFGALGRCALSRLSWALGVAAAASGLNGMALLLVGLSSWMHYVNGKIAGYSPAVIYDVLALVSMGVCVMLGLQLRAILKPQQPRPDKRATGGPGSTSGADDDDSSPKTGEKSASAPL
ncbi:MAG: hypothetical protein ACAI35_01710 [Candidatus Methylacidiphilales bacterium]